MSVTHEQAEDVDGSRSMLDSYLSFTLTVHNYYVTD